MLSRMDPPLHLDMSVTVLGETLVMINSVINSRAGAKDPVALAHKDQLQKLQGIDLPADPGPRYGYDPKTQILQATAVGEPFSGATIGGLTSYNDFLETNRAQLTAAWQALATGGALTYQADGEAAIQDKTLVGDKLLAAQKAGALETDRFRHQLTGNQEVVGAYLYVMGLVAPR